MENFRHYNIIKYKNVKLSKRQGIKSPLIFLTSEWNSFDGTGTEIEPGKYLFNMGYFKEMQHGTRDRDKPLCPESLPKS